MLPSQAPPRPEAASRGAVCLAGGAARQRQRGAVLVHVAVAMTGLLAFAALSIDLGTVWVVRAQVQNAADAAALAGGVSLAYVSPDADAAAAAAQAIALQHTVWGQAVTAASVSSVSGACPAGAPAVSGQCMTVTVQQGGASGTPLPVFFANIFSAAPVEVHASASAKVLLGNSAACVRPLAIPDRWTDTYDDTPPVDTLWRDDDLYARYDNTGTLNILPPRQPDTYVAPTSAGPGTGLTVADFAGVRITRRLSNSTAGLPLEADQLVALDLPRAEAYSERVYRYADNLESCNGTPMTVGGTVPSLWPHRGHYTTGPLAALIGLDPGAYWDDGTQSVRGSAFPVSPRLITIAVFDPDAYASQNRSGGGDPDIVIRNLVGFFVESVYEAGPVVVTGVVAPVAGSYNPTAQTLSDQAAFLRTVALVR